MRTNTKILALSSLTVLLAIIFVISLLFDSDRRTTRSAAYNWLDRKLAQNIDKIELKSAGGIDAGQLVKRDGVWFFVQNDNEYPARAGRIDDLIAALAKTAPYPIRASQTGSHRRLGVDDEIAARITLKTGVGLSGAFAGERTLLDLLIGAKDSGGRDVYLRKIPLDEVRSGADLFSAAVNSGPGYWYDLRLFPVNADSGFTVENIQRVRYFPPPPPVTDDGTAETAPAAGVPLTLARASGGWVAETNPSLILDTPRVESLVRALFDAESDGFLESDVAAATDAAFAAPDDVYGRIYIELGNGQTVTLSLGPQTPGSEGGAAYTPALVQNNPRAHRLSDWTINRLFRSVETLVSETANEEPNEP
jgi:hypothetical protein